MSACTKTVGIYTLGCKVNQYESEAIAERFEREGFSILPPTSACDVYVINTCTVTAESDRKARQFIRRAIKQRPDAFILVTGCMSQIQPAQVASIAGVDYICGNSNKLSVVDAALHLVKAGKKEESPKICVEAPDANGFEPMQITKFDRTRAYIKIEDGCESHCTYCTIPKARGTIRSKPAGEVLDEVRKLTENGCREVVLTGIETASYGRDLGIYGLADLLEEIDRIPNIGRVRLGSLDPSLIKPNFVERIAKLKSLTPHFHLSMQSGSDNVLANMKRKYNTRMALSGMSLLRSAIPTVQFTTDMIVGFPQETEEDFARTKQFIKDARFLMIHIFPYSKRSGTPAAVMSGQIPEEVKHARAAELAALQKEIRKDILNGMTGSKKEVLFETYKNGIAYGHTPDFVEVQCKSPRPLHAEAHTVTICSNDGNICIAHIDE